MMRANDDLLHYYQQELIYLRDQGAEFARKYPKVASKVALSGTESPDPHTERLIEAQAFLAARIHRDLDREFPQLAAALLDNLCPTLNQPIPAMSVAMLQLDPSQGKVTAGLHVPRHTSLIAYSRAEEACRLRTAWNTVLWPVQVAETRLIDGRQLRIRLRCDDGVDLADLELDSLRLHVGGDWSQARPLYDLLATGVNGVALCDGQGQVHRLSSKNWHEVGLNDDESVLPQAPHVAPAYGMLQEYFTFPRKFHFFEINGLRHRLGRGNTCELWLDLRSVANLPTKLDAHALRTGCVPVINLFTRTSEPIRLDALQHEYLLNGDRQHAAHTEVHSIISVHASDPDAERSYAIPPFATLNADAVQQADQVYWFSRREPSTRSAIPGSEVWLSFVNTHHMPAMLRHPVVYARTLCTNRRLVEQLTPGTRLRAEGLSAALHVECLYPASRQRPAPLAAQAMWQLIALLRLNHGSLVHARDPEDQAETLRGLLTLFSDRSAHDIAQIRSVRHLSARPSTIRIGQDAWRGYCRGTEVELEFDEEAFISGSPLLLSAVLARFFALYTTLNVFARLTVNRRNEIWHQWPPITGYQPLL
jgi:type VI secretion system protein ImpG